MNFNNSQAHDEVAALFSPLIEELLLSRFKQKVFNQLKVSAFSTDRVNSVNPFIERIAEEYTDRSLTPDQRKHAAWQLYSEVKGEYDDLVNGELFRTYLSPTAGLVFESILKKNGGTYPSQG